MKKAQIAETKISSKRTLPVIELGKFGDSSEELEEWYKRLREACEDWGVVLVSSTIGFVQI